MSKISEVKKRSRKTERRLLWRYAFQKKKTERRVNPVLIARLDEQNVGRR